MGTHEEISALPKTLTQPTRVCGVGLQKQGVCGATCCSLAALVRLLLRRTRSLCCDLILQVLRTLSWLPTSLTMTTHSSKVPFSEWRQSEILWPLARVCCCHFFPAARGPGSGHSGRRVAVCRERGRSPTPVVGVGVGVILGHLACCESGSWCRLDGQACHRDQAFRV